MVKTIDGVSGVVEQNSTATQQMAANSTQVSQSVDGISRIIEQNSASIQEMSASAEEMSAQVQEVVGAFHLDGADAPGKKAAAYPDEDEAYTREAVAAR